VSAPERDLAFDMVKRAIPLAPLVVLVAAVVRGSDGAASAGVAVALVVVNLLVAAAGLAWAATRSPATLMGTALGGFLLRMVLVVVVIALVRDQSWVDLPTLAVAVLATHLGLLAWETRYVSANLAYPSLKPTAKEAQPS
jgi:hypothetical protein